MESRFQSRVLRCNECGEEFAFTIAAQEYFAEKGYTEDPKRCKSCHTQFKKMQRDHHLPETVAHDAQYPD